MKPTVACTTMILWTLVGAPISGCSRDDHPIDKARDALDLRDHEKMRDAAEDVRDGVQEAAHDLKEGAKDLGREIRSGAREAAQDVKADTKRAAAEIKQSVKDAKSNAKDRD